MKFIASIVLLLGITELPSAMAEVPSKTNVPIAPDDVILEFSSALQAVVCSGAVGDMLHSNHSKRAATVYRNLAGGRNRDTPDSEIRAVMRRASPSSYVRKEVPPIMLVHGAKDTVVFIDSTDEFFNAMKAVATDITYLRFEDAGHVMGQKGAKTTPAMHAFFEKHLRGQRKGPG